MPSDTNDSNSIESTNNDGAVSPKNIVSNNTNTTSGIIHDIGKNIIGNWDKK